jgi:hypothetical protein
MLLLAVDHSRQCLRQLAPARIDRADCTGLAAAFTAAAQSVLTTLAIAKNVVEFDYGTWVRRHICLCFSVVGGSYVSS